MSLFSCSLIKRDFSLVSPTRLFLITFLHDIIKLLHSFTFLWYVRFLFFWGFIVNLQSDYQFLKYRTHRLHLLLTCSSMRLNYSSSTVTICLYRMSENKRPKHCLEVGISVVMGWKKAYPNSQSLWIWLYLEKLSLLIQKLEFLKWDHPGLSGWALNPIASL